MAQVAANDSPWSLGRAFQRAGARTVVMSLWKVSAYSTRLLMEAFYARLSDGAAPAQALRDAQLLLRSCGASPRQWGAFTCMGTTAIMPVMVRPARSPPG